MFLLLPKNRRNNLLNFFLLFAFTLTFAFYVMKLRNDYENTEKICYKTLTCFHILLMVSI